MPDLTAIACVSAAVPAAQVAGDAADPELRKVATGAQKTLQRIETEGKEKLAKTLDK